MTGAEYIAAFLVRHDMAQVYLTTGGACAFMVDAIDRHPDLTYYCFQHEQAAAMAADAVWRTSGKVGVAMATSGPGATNLLTGIACSFFDSIPALFITGQVNSKEAARWAGAKPRQSGFQETCVVDMAKPITKYAVMVRTGDELREELAKAYAIATTGRRGPVLIDVPMDIQQSEVGELITEEAVPECPPDITPCIASLTALLRDARRPVVLFGAGVGLSGTQHQVVAWLARTGLPFVSSWNGLGYFDHDSATYCGAIGVYGNRGANAVMQNADAVLVLGSRLDNRQRSADPATFASSAHVHVIDIDVDELHKFQPDGYGITQLDLRWFPEALDQVTVPRIADDWRSFCQRMRTQYLGIDTSRYAIRKNVLSPYAVVARLNQLMANDAIIACDSGANLCWVYQIFRRSAQTLFTAGGNSPMGYALPAAIGAALHNPNRQVIAFAGDGGFQVNIQELQTISHYAINVTVVILNNGCYGMIRQFQDSYTGGRHAGSASGYSAPDFGDIVRGYGLGYRKIQTLSELTDALLQSKGGMVVDVALDPATPIEPKLEMGRPINQQYPYLSDMEFAEQNPDWGPRI